MVIVTISSSVLNSAGPDSKPEVTACGTGTVIVKTELLYPHEEGTVVVYVAMGIVGIGDSVQPHQGVVTDVVRVTRPVSYGI